MQYKSSMILGARNRSGFIVNPRIFTWSLLFLIAFPPGSRAQTLPGPPALVSWISGLDPGIREGTGPASFADDPRVAAAAADTVRVSLGLDWGHLGLGTTGTLHRRGVRLMARAPVGRAGDALVLGYGMAEESLHLNDASPQEFRLSDRALVYLGLRSGLRNGLGGRWSILAMATGSTHPGAALQAEWQRTGFRITGLGWTGTSAAGILRAPSVAGNGVQQQGRSWGGSAGTQVTVPLGSRTRAGLELRGGYRRLGSEAPGGETGYLSVSPDGDAREGSLKILAARGRSLCVWGLLFRQDAAFRGPILQNGQSAGKLFYAESELRRSMVQIEFPGRGRVHSVAMGQDRYRTTASGRLETWAFADLWAQVAVNAFRARGVVDAELSWVEVRRRSENPAGWTLAAGVGRLRLDLAEEDWRVGPLGFGRTDFRKSVLRSDGVWVVSAEAGRGFRLGGGTVVVGVRTALPVAGSVESGGQGDGVGGRGGGDGWPGEVSAALSADW